MKFLNVFLIFLATVTASNRRSTHATGIRQGARITGGLPAIEAQFPYQAGLKIKLRAESVFCGGTLISKLHILTAAHCCEGAQKIEVVLGSVEIHNVTEPNRLSIMLFRNNVKIHDDWDSTKLANDICLLKFPREVQLSEHIKIAELPSDDTEDYFGQSVIATGWGLDSDHSETISSVLKFVKSKIIQNLVCKMFYFGQIRTTHLCTSGAGGMSTCSGDSGGPLVLEREEEESSTPVVVGITSFGSQFGCEMGMPPVFTRVSKYLEWIKANMS